ncbi:MAG: hypothetical protein WA057_02360 [Candidatus Magasanikiibacteriota bacterium]
MKNQTENLSGYCEKIIKEINDFYLDNKGYYHYSDNLNIFSYNKMPNELPVTGSVTAGYDEDGLAIYDEILLPNFIELTKKNGFDILNFDKNQYKENFLTLLDSNIEEFNKNQKPIIFRECIYFLRLHSKNLSGLPKTLEGRMSFMELKELFEYEYYRIDERDFFEMVISYINLYGHYEKIRKVNDFLKIAISIITIFLLGFLFNQ